MEPTITAYEYSDIKQHVNALVSAYLAVNDRHMRSVIRAETIAYVTPFLPEGTPLTQAFLAGLQPDRLSRKEAAKLLPLLEPAVIPFPQFSTKQLGKLFRKVKKLKQPAWTSLNLHELTYLVGTMGAVRRNTWLYQTTSGLPVSAVIWHHKLSKGFVLSVRRLVTCRCLSQRRRPLDSGHIRATAIIFVVIVHNAIGN